VSGFCGNCGAARQEGASFCMGCGSRLPDLPRLCPTCGQTWPQDPQQAIAVGPLVSTNAPVTYSRGAYSSPQGDVYFDGVAWYAAKSLMGDRWIPDPARPVAPPAPGATGWNLIQSEFSNSTVDLPRGPALGPDYESVRDCGNCGFDRPSGAGPCKHCGTENVGSTFVPGGKFA